MAVLKMADSRVTQQSDGLPIDAAEGGAGGARVDLQRVLSVPQYDSIMNENKCKVNERINAPPCVFAPPAPPCRETEQALNLFHADACLVELRPVMPDGRWWSGVFDDRNKLVKTIKALNQVEATAIYWTVNPLLPSLADRVTNRVAPARKGQCIGNKSIERIRWLFLDLDNKGSREATLTLAENIKTYLAGKGWGAPHLLSSGTGYYLFYPVDLPLDQAPLIKKVVHTLAGLFDTPEAIVDRKCANPGRIARVPGTYNRKETATLCQFVEVANG